MKSVDHQNYSSEAESLPTRGAWIEIWRVSDEPKTEKRRSPHGERGLKYGLSTQGVGPKVAPHTGSVD